MFFCFVFHAKWSDVVVTSPFLYLLYEVLSLRDVLKKSVAPTTPRASRSGDIVVYRIVVNSKIAVMYRIFFLFLRPSMPI